MKRNLFFGLLLIALAGTAAFKHLQKEKEKGSFEFFEDENEEEEEEEEEREGHQTGADKQMQTFFWSKGYPDPTNLGGKYLKAWEQYLDIKANTNQLLNNAASRTAGFGNWTTVGTSVAGIGGRVVCMTFDPNNANNLFIGTASGGLYKTTNGGSSWTYVPTGKPVLGIGAVTYHPTSSSVLLAGTGEVYRVNGASQGNIGFNVWKCRGTYGIGLLRSTNGGATWTQVLNKESDDLFAIQEIAYDPANANIVYACATDGLYKSTDGGVTWPATPLYAKTYVRDIAINPTNGQQMVISVGNLVNSDKGLYRTTNGGTSWTKLTAVSTTYKGYAKLDNNGVRLYAGCANGSGNELWMSNDFGATWSQKSGSSYASSQYWFAQDIAVDNNDADELMVGGVNYYKYSSTDAATGGALSAISTSMHADVHDIEFHPTNSSIIYVAHDGGISKSTDGGASFSDINTGLNAVQFYASFAVSPTNANVMIGGLQDNGVVKWNGTSWTKILGGDGGPSMFHPKNGSKAIYSNDARAVFYSGDAGASETQKLLNLGYGYSSAYDDRTAFMSPVGMSYPTTTANGIVMYAASDNLHISTDSGGTFARASPSGMTRYIDALYKPAIALGVSQTNRDKVYVSTSPLSQRADDGLNFAAPAKILRSTNASDNTNYSFSNISGSLPDRFTTDFAISKYSDDSVYITMGGFGSGHVWLTPDGGTTWINRSSGLPDVPFNAIVVDPVRPSVIYAACDFGVYVSHNRGVNWYDFNNNFDDATMVMDLQVTADRKLVAATHGKGVYRTDLFVPPAGLPVKFESFDGTHMAGMNDLRWFVSGESSLLHYQLERSTDGFAFQKIATVKAVGNGGAAAYAYPDGNLPPQAQVLYYRLKAVDGNGTYFYSDVVALQNPQGHSGLQVLGNPFSNQLRFRYQTAATGKFLMHLSDMSGRTVRIENRPLTGITGVYTVDKLDALPTGLYVLTVQAGNERHALKLTKR